MTVTATDVKSPDGTVDVAFILQNGGVPAYTVSYLGQPVILESRLGLLPDLTDGFEIAKVSESEHHGEWTQVYGERKIVPDNYRELDVDLKQASGRLLHLTFRAYNEGAAFRYSFPQATQEIHLLGERTEFRFPPKTYGYAEHGTEGEYSRQEISTIAPWCERPLTLEFKSGLFASLAEADNENYPRMLLSPEPGAPDTLVTALGGTTSNTALAPDVGDPTATLKSGESTPWRLLVVGQKAGDLLERNYLMLNLNPPLALSDTSWIKPGNVMRDVALTTATSKAIIDRAATAGLQYVLLDSGWYGTENAVTGDATTPRRARNSWWGDAPGPVDIAEIVRYGRTKNVGLILYVDRRQMKKQRDILFSLYEKWGVKGVKIGFVDVGPQSETAWITETIKQAAAHHLVLNIHDGYRPSGFARTYPNLLTVEGVCGNEHFPTPEHNCTLPFTRYIAGSADYTICYHDRRLQTTHAHQMAMAVVSYSPLQSLYWYDRPEMIHGEPELEFFRHLPTVWDETKVIAGDIGKYAVIARRSGNDWFIGVINNSEPRPLKLPLTFLTTGQHYKAHIYADDASVPTDTQVGISTRPVDSTTALDVPLGSAGGEAIWIESAH